VRLDELLHQTGWRVVGARELALGALDRIAIQADVTEGPGRLLDEGMQLEQALVDRAELLGVHVPIVDAGKALGAGGGEEGERFDRAEEGGVGKLGCEQVRRLSAVEQAAQRRGADLGRAALQRHP
jgi:hypothetical protein